MVHFVNNVRSFMNYAIFCELCDRMRFEVDCAKSHHRVISEGLTLRRWLIFLFSFTLRTFWTLKQPLLNHGTITLNVVLLFRSRIAFRRGVKIVKNIVRKHTQFIKG